MKLLMIYASRFAYMPVSRTLEDFPEVHQGAEFEQVLVASIHAEEQDEAEPKKVEDKLLKNLKWAAKKNDTDKIVLHSFAHLAETKAEPAPVSPTTYFFPAFLAIRQCTVAL